MSPVDVDGRFGRAGWAWRRLTARAAVVAVALVGLGAPAVPGLDTKAPRGTAPVPLRDLADRRGILVGTAARPEMLARDARYRRVLGSEFNLVTAENVMKWPAVQPAPHRYDFRAADTLVSFAQRHHMAVRGHNLLTGGTNPAGWVLNGHFSSDALASIVQDHITTEVSHFRGKVIQWDVVNEALTFGGSLERNVWYAGLGPDYIDRAFRWAHDADPNAVLFYNEDDVACDQCSGPFPTATEARRDDAIYNLVAALKQRGVPIDGVGIQMHLWATPPDTVALASFMARLRGLGLQVAVTEMDVRLPNRHTARDLARQAQVYGDVLNVCLAAPNCKTFVTWGFTDAVSWIPAYLPGLGSGDIFDTSYHPKPAYDALHRALAGS